MYGNPNHHTRSSSALIPLSSDKQESVEKEKAWSTGGSNHTPHERNHIAGATVCKAVNNLRAAQNIVRCTAVFVTHVELAVVMMASCKAAQLKLKN